MLMDFLLRNSMASITNGPAIGTQLLETINTWSRLLEEGIPLDLVYLDFRKAFDSVPHKRLLSKLQS